MRERVPFCHSTNHKQVDQSVCVKKYNKMYVYMYKALQGTQCPTWYKFEYTDPDEQPWIIFVHVLLPGDPYNR